MPRILSIAILVAFGIGLFLLFVSALGTSGREQVQFMLPLVSRAVGLFVAAVSLLTLLVLAIHGSSGRLISGFALPLLGGLYLVAPHWGLAASVALVLIASKQRQTGR